MPLRTLLLHFQLVLTAGHLGGAKRTPSSCNLSKCSSAGFATFSLAQQQFSAIYRHKISVSSQRNGGIWRCVKLENRAASPIQRHTQGRGVARHLSCGHK